MILAWIKQVQTIILCLTLGLKQTIETFSIYYTWLRHSPTWHFTLRWLDTLFLGCTKVYKKISFAYFFSFKQRIYTVLYCLCGELFMYCTSQYCYKRHSLASERGEIHQTNSVSHLVFLNGVWLLHYSLILQLCSKRLMVKTHLACCWYYALDYVDIFPQTMLLWFLSIIVRSDK